MDNFKEIADKCLDGLLHGMNLGVYLKKICVQR